MPISLVLNAIVDASMSFMKN